MYTLEPKSVHLLGMRLHLKIHPFGRKDTPKVYGENARSRLHSYQDRLLIIWQKKEVQHQAVTKEYFCSVFKITCQPKTRRSGKVCILEQSAMSGSHRMLPV